MERFMGRWITPVLLLPVVILCTAAIMNFDTKQLAPSSGYDSGAFFKGFLEGYNTMDALAALAFGIVILTAIQKKGVHDEKQLSRYTLRAAIIAGGLLAAVYISFGLLGVKIAANGTFENGTAILSSASTLFFGKAGTSFIGVIFTLACFTTVVGLTSACGQYFSKLLPKASYKFVITAVTLIGFTLSNIGLNQILKVSVPFLVTAYPLTIVLITLSFFNGIFTNPRKVYGSAILFTGVFAALGGLSTFGFDLGALQTLWEISPSRLCWNGMGCTCCSRHCTGHPSKQN